MATVSVLVIEDSASKAKLIAEALRSTLANSVEITTIEDTATARRLMRSTKYDLLILDVALPAFPKEMPRPRAGLDFLKEILTIDDYHAPTYIVGITEYDEEFDELAAEFESRAWPLCKSKPSETGWIKRIEVLGRHILNTKAAVASRVDIAVITALYDPEFIALLDLPWNWSVGEILDEATMFRKGTFSEAGKDFSVIATWPQRMGLVAAASLASKIIHLFRPRVLASSGICAGIRGKVDLGDIVFASEAWTWESGKIVAIPEPGTVLPDPHSVAASTVAVTLGQQMQGESAWRVAIRDDWGERGVPVGTPKFHIGPMASGSAVVSDGAAVEAILRKSRKTVAIDMEAYAIYAAAMLSGQPVPKCFCVKGVSDFADSRKNDKYRKYAAYSSSRALEVLCRRVGREL